MAKITMIEAITLAHAWEMAHDPNVVVLGEDVGVNGGVFRATQGLQEKFGKDRVQDTPLAELGIAGISIGMATQGLKPVAEIQFSGFVYPTIDQIANGRTIAGLGCGWFATEFEAYGCPFPPVGERLRALEERTRGGAAAFTSYKRA